MTIEHDSLINNHTWDLVPLPLGKNCVRCKWVYNMKFIVHGHV
jgi:hypothetical protein